jgi:hypothetical protein
VIQQNNCHVAWFRDGCGDSGTADHEGKKTENIKTALRFDDSARAVCSVPVMCLYRTVGRATNVFLKHLQQCEHHEQKLKY